MQDARARSRQARKSFYHFLEKIPQLYITWAAVSGIMLSALAREISTTDLMVPLTDEFPYYSQYLFGIGFLVSSITSMVQNFGMGLQVEHRLKKNGVFNHIPEGEDVHLNFMQWFFKQLKNKNNTYLKNTMTIMRIVWANVPATLLLMSITHPLIMGRFPLDLYIIGYLMYFIFPIWGLNTKIEQAMEGAMAGYWMKFFPKELRGHPLIQNYALRKKAKYRAGFQFFYTFFYSNILYATIDNFQYMGINSSRELARVLFFGHPPTVWAIKGFNTIREFFDQTPFVNKVIDTCQTALTNGYDGWDPKLDGPIPENLSPWIPKKTD